MLLTLGGGGTFEMGVWWDYWWLVANTAQNRGYHQTQRLLGDLSHKAPEGLSTEMIIAIACFCRVFQSDKDRAVELLARRTEHQRPAHMRDGLVVGDFMEAVEWFEPQR